ncbi:hypothetical protein GCM10020295_47400 [Streptomyces cinereospinus]
MACGGGAAAACEGLDGLDGYDGYDGYEGWRTRPCEAPGAGALCQGAGRGVVNGARAHGCEVRRARRAGVRLGVLPYALMPKTA